MALSSAMVPRTSTNGLAIYRCNEPGKNEHGHSGSTRLGSEKEGQRQQCQVADGLDERVFGLERMTSGVRDALSSIQNSLTFPPYRERLRVNVDGLFRGVFGPTRRQLCCGRCSKITPVFLRTFFISQDFSSASAT